MQKITKIGSAVLFGSMIFLLFLVVFESVLHIPGWLAVAGRMHPMFLHFPIVLLLLSFFTVWIPKGNDTSDQWLNLLRLVAALSAVITAIMGMLLSLEDGRSGDLLQQHKWGGVVIAIFGFLFYSYFPLLAKRFVFTRIFTVIATIVIVITGHWGADLTHGTDYVLAPIKKSDLQLVPPDKAVIFADVIQPILDKKCITCHGESSTKGGLLLSNLKGVLAGGKSGPLFIPGQPDTSLIIHRIHLAGDDKKRMPPLSKPQLTEAEASILYAWIKSGAATDAKLFSLPEKDSFRILATSYLLPGENITSNEPVYTFEAADEKKVLALNNNYRIVVPLGKNSPALAVNFFGKNAYNSKALEELLPVKQQVIELSLARMPVKDDDLKTVQQLENLRKLNLNYTDITPKGIETLASLKNLRELTLSGTAVTADALEKILPLPDLAEVYVWDTKIDSTQLGRLKNKYPKMLIENGFVDKGGDIVALSPPMIKSPGSIFDKDVQVELRHPFKGVEIRYTLDGTEPDSVTGTIYTAPIPVTKNTTINAKAFKKGWYGSGDAKASFIKRSIIPDSAIAITPSDMRYRATNAEALYDGLLGDYNNNSNGDWYGYNKNDAAYYLLFKKEVTVSNVLVNMMQNLGGYIFPATKIDVWGGKDSLHMSLLGSVKPPIPPKGDPTKLVQQDVQFAPAQVQCLKIVAQPIRSLPQWHDGKGKEGWVFISEVVLN
ncbi:MAG: chitobiase/beta-hexosaminidase C-terminal domain-containing protein [Agriterribacter sp.]